MKSAAQAEIRLQQLEEKKRRLDKKLETVRERESKQQWQLQNQLDESVAGPLRSVDPRLMMASSGRDLDANSKSAIEAFARLFEPSERGFEWFDTEYQPQPVRQENFAEQRQRLHGELNGLETERLELTNTTNQQHDRPRLIDRTEKEIRAIENDLDTLARYPAVETSLSDATEENERRKKPWQNRRNRPGKSERNRTRCRKRPPRQKPKRSALKSWSASSLASAAVWVWWSTAFLI